MKYRQPHNSLSWLFACTLPLGLAACELDDSSVIAKKDGGAATTTTGGTAGAPSATTGMGGSASTTTAGGSAGSGGAATTTMGAGGAGGSAGPGGNAGSGGSAGGAGGAGGDMGGAGGAGGDMGGAGGAGGDMGGAGGAGGGPIGPVKNPTAVAVVGSNLTLEQHPSVGGSPFTDQCQANEVLIGFDATMDANPDSANPWLKSLSGICGALSLLGSGPYTVGVTQTIKLTTRGAVSDKVFPETKCPDNQMIVGYRGNSGTYIDSVAFDCAPLVVTGDATDGYTVAVDMTTLTPIGPLGGTGGGAFGPYPCDAGQVSNGVNGHSGAWFDGFGLTCGVVSLTGMKR